MIILEHRRLSLKVSELPLRGDSDGYNFYRRCACCTIRYECSADAPQSFNCHCRDCQRATGSAYTSFLVVPTENAEIGPRRTEISFGQSGHTTNRGFCAECGSPVLAKITEVPTIMVILAASLDDPSWHRPTPDSSAQPWAS